MMLRHDLRTDAHICGTSASQASLFVHHGRGVNWVYYVLHYLLIKWNVAGALSPSAAYPAYNYIYIATTGIHLRDYWETFDYRDILEMSLQVLLHI